MEIYNIKVMESLKDRFNVNLLKALILVFIGGYLELFSFIYFNAFSGMQTGNLIYIFTNLIDSNYMKSLFYLFILLAFIVGIIFSELLHLFLKKKEFLYRIIIYSTMIVFLSLSLIFKTLDQINPDYLFYGGPILFSLTGALLSHSFTKLNSHQLSTTMMTAMIKQITAKIVDGIKEKNITFLLDALDIFLIIISFVIGVVIFYVLHPYIDFYYHILIVLCMIVLLIIVEIINKMLLNNHNEIRNQKQEEI